MSRASKAWDPLQIPKHQLKPQDYGTGRSTRKRPIRAITIPCHRISKYERDRARKLYPEESYWRPKTRADCAKVIRPCLYVACKYNLYLDVNELHSIKYNFPDIQPSDMVDSCALDIAEEGGMSLEDVGAAINVTRERVRQIETMAMARISKGDTKGVLQELVAWDDELPQAIPRKLTVRLPTKIVFNAIRDNPGITIGELRKLIPWANSSQITSTIGRLYTQRKLRKHGLRGQFRYYLKDHPTQAQLKELLKTG